GQLRGRNRLNEYAASDSFMNGDFCLRLIASAAGAVLVSPAAARPEAAAVQAVVFRNSRRLVIERLLTGTGQGEQSGSPACRLCWAHSDRWAVLRKRCDSQTYQPTLH